MVGFAANDDEIRVNAFILAVVLIPPVTSGGLVCMPLHVVQFFEPTVTGFSPVSKRSKLILILCRTLNLLM